MSDIWIFGYGSLIWRPDFPHLEARVADLVGWARRFWQGSTDHRGVPGAPGRVVTLLRAADKMCRGMAYRVAAAERQAVLERLDFREKGGYRLAEVGLKLAGADAPTPGVVYIATPENPNYLGPAPLDEIAAQVRASSGPSGDNVDYVLKLAAALRAFGSADEHVFELARLVGGGEGNSPGPTMR